MIYELDELECMTILRRTCEMIDPPVGKRTMKNFTGIYNITNVQS